MHTIETGTLTARLVKKILKVVSATFLLICFFFKSQKECFCETKENVFLFHFKSSVCCLENQSLDFWIFNFHDVMIVMISSIEQGIHFTE